MQPPKTKRIIKLYAQLLPYTRPWLHLMMRAYTTMKQIF